MPDLFVAKEEKKKDTPPDLTSEENTTPAKPSLTSLDDNITKHMRALAAFSQYPNNITFENQEENEFIILFLRRHIITNTGWIFLTLIFALLPLFATMLLLPVLAIIGITIPGNFVLVLMSFYYLIVFGYAYVHYVSWFFNIDIVKNAFSGNA